MDIKITLEENGISGFLIRDITGISPLGFASSTSGISPTLRTNDIVFLDIITQKKVDENISKYFTMDIKSDAMYNTYVLNYQSEYDGWFNIVHAVVPKKEWIEHNKPSLANGDYYCYYCMESKYYKATVFNGTVTYILSSEEEINENRLTNENLLGATQDVFLIGYIEKCFEEKIKHIIYNNLYSKCSDRSFELQNLYKERDILMMIYETIKFAVKSCRMYEAQRLLEQISQCSGLCNTSNLTNNSRKCNCR